MSLRTAVSADLDGLSIDTSLAAAEVGGDEFVNTGKEILIVKNADASDKTVTISAQNNCSHGFAHDGGGTVTAGETAVFGPFNKNRFNDTSEKVQVAYSAVTSVSIAVAQVIYE
jgi:hypothetical protein